MATTIEEMSTETREPTFSGPEMVILVVTSLGHAVCHMAELIFPAVMIAVMTDLELEPHEATLLAVLGYALMGIGAVPVGLWADAWDPWKIHFLFLIAVIVSCITVMLSFNPFSLFVSLTLLGLATSIYHPTGLAMLSLGVRRKSLAMGVNGVAGSLGIASAPLVGELACRYSVWQTAYLAVAGLATVASLVTIAAWKLRYRASEHVAQHLAAQGAGADEPGVFFGFPFMLLCVMVLGGFNYRCLATALPPYLSNVTLIDGISNTFLVMLVGGCIGQIVSGRLGDRFGPRGIYLGSVALLVPTALLLGFVGGTVNAVLVAGFVAIFLFGQQPVENALLAQYSSIRRRSLSFGTKFIMTFGVGALGTQVVGVIWNRTGSQNLVFWFIAASASLMLAVLALWCVRNPARDTARTTTTSYPQATRKSPAPIGEQV